MVSFSARANCTVTLVAAGLATMLVLLVAPSRAHAQLNCDAVANLGLADVNCNNIRRNVETDGLRPGLDCLDRDVYPTCTTNDDAPISRKCDDYVDSTPTNNLGATCGPYAVDSDGDCIGDTCDNCVDLINIGQADADNDGVGDLCDNCVNANNPGQIDSDGGGLGDACDSCPDNAADDLNQSDMDGDFVGDICDNCLMVANTDQIDGDVDTLGNVCDNCPNVANLDQADMDADAAGDVCDNCPFDANADQADGDNDAVGTVCDICPDDADPAQADTDADTFGDACDVCPADFNPDQQDNDLDGWGDGCDNCPVTPNPDQAVSELTFADGRQMGVACEPGIRGPGCSSSVSSASRVSLWLPAALLLMVMGLWLARRRKQRTP